METTSEQIKFNPSEYVKKLSLVMGQNAMNSVEVLAKAFLLAWKEDKCIYICGNGGSAANAMHIANDLIYGAGVKSGRGLKVEALSSNGAVMTCLGNDLGYSSIFSEQLKVKGQKGDVLLVLSGSGNSENIVNALITAKDMNMNSFAILGYTGGKCKSLADCSIHFEIDDMQIAEDLQLIIGHICMQWLCQHSV